MPHLRRATCVDLLISDGNSVWLEPLLWVEEGYSHVSRGAMRSFLPSWTVAEWSCVTGRTIACFSNVAGASNRSSVSDISMNTSR